MCSNVFRHVQTCWNIGCICAIWAAVKTPFLKNIKGGYTISFACNRLSFAKTLVGGSSRKLRGRFSRKQKKIDLKPRSAEARGSSAEATRGSNFAWYMKALNSKFQFPKKIGPSERFPRKLRGSSAEAPRKQKSQPMARDTSRARQTKGQ